MFINQNFEVTKISIPLMHCGSASVDDFSHDFFPSHDGLFPHLHIPLKQASPTGQVIELHCGSERRKRVKRFTLNKIIQNMI